MQYTSFDFVKEEEKSVRPEYTLVDDDATSIVQGIEWAEKYCNDKRTLLSKVLIVGTSDSLVNQIVKYLEAHNKRFECLKGRSDEMSLKKAQDGNKFVISQIDYVGGLEFDAVVIIGVDEGRVPPSRKASNDAYHVISYAWHSRMYVAVTRAKYAVKILGESSRGPSHLLYTSIVSDVVEYTGHSIYNDD